MKIKQTILMIAIIAGVGSFLATPKVSALESCGQSILAAGESCCGGVVITAGQSCCGGVVTSIINCGETGTPVVSEQKVLSCRTGEDPVEGSDPESGIPDATARDGAKKAYFDKYDHYYGKCADGTDSVMAIVVAEGATCPTGEDPYAEGVDPVFNGHYAVDIYYSTYKHYYGKCINGTFPVLGSQFDSGLWGILKMVINIMTAGIGITAVGGLLYGGILYASSGGSPDNVKKSKTIITDIVIGLVAYALMYAFLNFIIPGGMFA